MRKLGSHTPTPAPSRLAVILSLNCVALVTLSMVLSAVSASAQQPTRPATRVGTVSDCRPSWGAPCGLQQVGMGDLPALPKAELPDDEKCLPWGLSRERNASTSVTTLKVPSKARREFEKACDAYHKKKFSAAEQQVRGAIEKFQDYSAAWVMLGVVLDVQGKAQEARDACIRATKTDSKYLPAYLCAAEFSVRKQEWEQLLRLANVALGLDSEGNGYAHYYRAMANFHLNNLAEARMSALQAAEKDANHNYLPLYFLLAQIYNAEGNKASAATQLRQVLKHHPDQQQEDVARQYLTELDVEAASTAAGEHSATVDGEALALDSAGRSGASITDLNNPSRSWTPENIDHAVPPVAPGMACSLPAVLNGAGQRIVELVQNVDRFTATELITHQVMNQSGQLGPPIAVQSDYLVSFTERPSGYVKVEEFRNGNQSRDSFPEHIATIGTPSLVLIFHPLYVNNFKMECEGLGEWNGQPAWQVRFEQRIDRVNRTLSFTVNQVEYTVRLKGRAWILADTFQVARLETDLTESIPKIRLRLFHESLEYRPVKSPTGNTQLWLPSGAELYMDFRGRRFYRQLSFTDFKLFSVGMQYQTSDPKRPPAAPETPD